MSVQEIANEFVALCRQGKFDEVQNKFYAENARSIEPMAPQPAVGMEAIREKGEQFDKGFEVHGVEVSDPIVADNFFSCNMILDATNRQTNERAPMAEICVFEVQNEKIVLEQFFYAMPPQE